ncbi:TPA: phage major capsid protein, partial [Pseudomonas aeruginosa]|nr:phage major capsid protein [Pseudomonas aeruginosa]
MPTAIEQEYQQVQADLKKVGDDLRTYAEQSEKELKAHSKLSEETKASVDKLLVSQGELQARLQAAEQLMAKLEKGGGRIVAPESMGETFIAAEGYDAWAARAAGGAKGSFTVPVKAAITSLTGSAGDLIQPQRVGMVLPTQQRLFV